MSTLKVNTVLSADTPTVNITDGLNVTGVSTVANITATTVTSTNIVNATQLSHRNLIINGAMRVAQRGTSSTTSGMYSVDRFLCQFGGTDEALTQSQHSLTSSDTGPYEEGFIKSFHIQNGNQTGGAGAADFVEIYTALEDQDISTCGWNYKSSSSYLTISFWVRSSVAQKFAGFLYTNDAGQANSYMYSYQIDNGSGGNLTANTWTKVTHSIPGNSSLTFNNDATNGMKIGFFPFNGTDYTTSGHTENTWAAWSSSNKVKDMTSTWYTTNDATFEITGVQLEVGSVATPFEHRSLLEEYLRCLRYYQRYGSSGNGNTFQDLRPMGHSNATVEIMTDFRGVPMRASPTVAFSGSVNIRGCASTYSDNTVTLAGNNFALADDGVSQTGHFWVSASSGTPFSASYSGRVTGASNGTYIEFRAEL